MRILWHGIGPWHKTGYGVQTRVFVPRLRDLGHEVVMAVMGRPGIDKPVNQEDAAAAETLGVTWAHPDAEPLLRSPEWRDIPVVGPGLTEFGLPMPLQIRDAFGGHEPDLIIVLKDAWVLSAASYRKYNTAVWCNIDCDPMGWPDAAFFAESGARPIATSLFGLSAMRAKGLRDALYVPHGIDLAQWSPGPREAARDLLGLPQGTFLAGINAANIGPRKGWGEQLGAFAAFHGKLQPDSLLLLHTRAEHPEGISLRDLAAELGISDAVAFGAHMNMRGPQMLNWYRSLDVLLNCTYGEGYGLPIVEAMACGIPVIGTESSAISEKIPPGAGWLVPGQRWWHPHFRAWWTIPKERAITAKLAHAHIRPLKPQGVAAHAARYDADLITKEHWAPVLEELAP